MQRTQWRAYRRAEQLRKSKELEAQERDIALKKQRQIEIERKIAERMEVRRLCKTFSVTLEGTLVLSIPPKVATSTFTQPLPSPVTPHINYRNCGLV
jgi:hypothetical protein